MNIYVENLEDSIDNKKLKEVFSPYGEVLSAEVVMDVFINVSRGFGYVEMEDSDADKAIAALDQTLVNELKIHVREAAPKVERKGSYKVGSGAIKEYRFKKN